VLWGIDITVNEGEIVTLVGANGAGKSTTLKNVSRLVSWSKGSIMFRGEDLAGLEPHEVVGRGLIQVPEARRIFPRMTVRENLLMGAYVRSDPEVEDDATRVLDLFPRLKERWGQLGGTLSGGEQQMLAMGRALMARPKVLLMDEPSMGLSPIMVDKIFEVVDTIHKQGTTILLVEQNASRALALANRGYVMESGEVTMSGPAQKLLDDPKVRAAYLGE
jgi:branched-chain amino acid transport system ATP-binding protein